MPRMLDAALGSLGVGRSTFNEAELPEVLRRQCAQSAAARELVSEARRTVEEALRTPRQRVRAGLTRTSMGLHLSSVSAGAIGVVVDLNEDGVFDDSGAFGGGASLLKLLVGAHRAGRAVHFLSGTAGAGVTYVETLRVLDGQTKNFASIAAWITLTFGSTLLAVRPRSIDPKAAAIRREIEGRPSSDDPTKTALSLYDAAWNRYYGHFGQKAVDIDTVLSSVAKAVATAHKASPGQDGPTLGIAS